MKLSYSTNSINTNSLLDSCREIMQAGYSGVEVCFNKSQFNPFTLDDNKLAKLYQEILDLNLNIVALSTATTFFYYRFHMSHL